MNISLRKGNDNAGLIECFINAPGSIHGLSLPLSWGLWAQHSSSKSNDESPKVRNRTRGSGSGHDKRVIASHREKNLLHLIHIGPISHSYLDSHPEIEARERFRL